MGTKKVAIACQGGGTHAAFTWGVLTRILETKKSWDSDGNGVSFDVVGVSGTSAGALCALATWYGLVPNTADPECGTIDKAIERLNFLWTIFGATTGIEILHNQVVASMLSLKSKGMPFPGTNPYLAAGEIGLTGLAMMGARQEYISFPGLLDALCPNFQTIDWSRLATMERRIIVGAIEVLSGNFEVFDSEKTLEEMGLHPDGERIEQYDRTHWRMRRRISLEGVAASGTLPEVLPAQEIPDMVFPTSRPGKTVTRTGHYWDGLYSQNPPVGNFLDAPDPSLHPDEIWVVRINPQEQYNFTPDIGLDDIKDRENALAGNLALNQELDRICTINEWIREHGTAHPPLSARKVVTVRTIKMTRDTVWGMKYTTKFDRSTAHLNSLHDEGREIAAQWLAEWRAHGSDFACYPNDARFDEPL